MLFAVLWHHSFIEPSEFVLKAAVHSVPAESALPAPVVEKTIVTSPAHFPHREGYTV